jgi:hypothetical protein
MPQEDGNLNPAVSGLLKGGQLTGGDGRVQGSLDPKEPVIPNAFKWVNVLEGFIFPVGPTR